MKIQEYNDKINSLDKRISHLELQNQELEVEKKGLESDPEKNASNIERINYQLEANNGQIEQTLSDKKTIEKDGFEKDWTGKVEKISEQVYNATLAAGMAVYTTVSPINEINNNALDSYTNEQYFEQESSNPLKPLAEIAEAHVEIIGRREKIEESVELGGSVYQDKLKPVEYQSSDNLLQEYQSEYQEAKFETGSIEKAKEIANDKLLEKLEAKTENIQEKGNSALTSEQKEEKIKELLTGQYGEKGREDFEKSREQEKPKQQEVQQEQSKNM